MPKPSVSPPSTPERQRGAVLIIGLIILLVMTMLGLTAMQSTSLEERMAGNMRDRSVALQVAEIALRAGEQAVFDSTPDVSAAWVFDIQTDPAPDVTDETTWSGSSTSYMTSDPISGDGKAFPTLADTPKYLVEARPGAPSSAEAGIQRETVYTVTARATGANDATVVVIQSTVRN